MTPEDMLAQRVSTQADDRKLVFLFGGQGAQYFQMGRELLDEQATFRYWMERGDALVAHRTGFSLLHEIYGGHHRISDPFDDFEVSHPALFLFQYALARTFIEEGARADMMLGVSLGEAVACSLLDVFSFDAALASVTEQARVLVQAAPRGRLISVLAPRTIVEESPLLRTHCELAGDFADEHFVLACLEEHHLAVEAYLRSRDALYVALPVQHPFHSRWMDGVRHSPGCVLGRMAYHRPTADFISCTEAARVPELAPDHFWWTLRNPIFFRQAIRNLEAAGSYVYVDFTPSGTLAHLARSNFAPGSRSVSHVVNSPFGRDRARWDGVAEMLRQRSASAGR